MRVYVSLDSNEFVVSPTLLQRVSTLYFVRRDVVPVEVQFCRDGVVTELGSGATGECGIKATYTGSFLAYDSAWTKSGTGSSTVYQFDLNLNTVAMDAVFNPDASTDSITAKIEISWSVGGTTSTTLPTSATVYNDVIRGGESVPTVTAAGSFLLQSPDSSLWSVSIANDGTLSATKSA